MRQTDASARMWAELGDYCLGQKRLDKAADAFKRGLMCGLDTAIVWSRIRSQPDLFTYLKL